MEKHILKYSNLEIEVTFKAIKNLHLSVHPPEGRVTISSPEFYDLEKVRIYVATKFGWIKKEQRKFKNQLREDPRLFINQESHYFLGERYLLQIEKSKKSRVEKKGKRLVIHINDTNDFSSKQSVLNTFYRNNLREQIGLFLEKYSLIMQVPIPKITIRSMKTKWGSCADSGTLLFNIELAKKPLECIEYIVVHEMVHLIERRHNKRFIQLMDQFLPLWRIQKKKLNELPL